MKKMHKDIKSFIANSCDADRRRRGRFENLTIEQIQAIYESLPEGLR